MGSELMGDAFSMANLLPVEILERFRAIEKLHSKVAAPYYRTAINLDRPWDCAGCGPGHRWPCATLEILTGCTEPEPGAAMAAERRPAPTVEEVWAAAPAWLQETQHRALAATDEDALWAREPQETYSPDSGFEELPEELLRQCCPGKSCGTTQLLRIKTAELIDDEPTVIYSYVRSSNGDSYFSSKTVEGLVAQLNDPEYWPNSRSR